MKEGQYSAAFLDVVVLYLAPFNLREVFSLYHLIPSQARAMVGGFRPSLAAEWIWKLLSMSGAPEVDESLLYDCAPGILPARTSEPGNCAFGPSVQMAEPLFREVWARFVGCYPPSILIFAKNISQVLFGVFAGTW